MDPYKLLSRSTKLTKTSGLRHERSTPSSGQQTAPTSHLSHDASRKRKRGVDVLAEASVDFFGATNHASLPKRLAEVSTLDDAGQSGENGEMGNTKEDMQSTQAQAPSASIEERRQMLKKHKVKATWLNSHVSRKKHQRQPGDKIEHGSKGKLDKVPLFPDPLLSFQDLRTKFALSPRLVENIDDQRYSVPTEVQLGALPLLMDEVRNFGVDETLVSNLSKSGDVDLLAVAPTGSGKTLAFMIPLLHRILRDRQRKKSAVNSICAIIVAPTKELASQIANEGRKLSRRTGVKVALVRKGMKLGKSMDDGEVLDTSEKVNSSSPLVKADILVSTPGLLSSMIDDAADSLSDVRQLVLDEADVLLDPLFREQTLAIWNKLTNQSLRVSLWSATMGSNIEELAVSVIDQRRKTLRDQSSGKVPQAPLIRLVIGLKDSAIPNVQHRLIYAASEQGKLMGLRQLLHPTTSNAETGPSLLPPFLVFTQTIERAVALHSELLYDIPTEAGGIGRIAVLHSDLSDTARDSVMTRFRKGEIWVLITTDLLSRGVDFRGVNGVVNFDIPTSSAAYVHRVGRTGRAGREGGVAVTLYSKDDIPYLKQIANVVALAQKQRGSNSPDDVQPWLLNALPNMSKQAKQDLKKRGVQSRTARGMQKDLKKARKARISTKSGYVRQEENKRRGAVLGSRRRQEATSDDGEETGLGGFD